MAWNWRESKWMLIVSVHILYVLLLAGGVWHVLAVPPSSLQGWLDEMSFISFLLVLGTGAYTAVFWKMKHDWEEYTYVDGPPGEDIVFTGTLGQVTRLYESPLARREMVGMEYIVRYAGPGKRISSEVERGYHGDVPLYVETGSGTMVELAADRVQLHIDGERQRSWNRLIEEGPHVVPRTDNVRLKDFFLSELTYNYQPSGGLKTYSTFIEEVLPADAGTVYVKGSFEMGSQGLAVPTSDEVTVGVGDPQIRADRAGDLFWGSSIAFIVTMTVFVLSTIGFNIL